VLVACRAASFSPGSVACGVPWCGVNHNLTHERIGTCARPVAARRSHRLIAVSAMTGLVLACAGCSDDAPAQGPDVTATIPPTSASSSAPESDDDAALRAAEADYFRLYAAALARPDDEAAVDALLAIYAPGGAGVEDMRARMKGLADRGYAGRPGPDGYFVVERTSVPSAAEGARATVTVCVFDDAVVYDTEHEGPDGKPVVVNDKVESTRTEVRWIRQGGTWRLEGGDVVERWPGVNRCPPPG
jgi:hypothetical protein